MFDYPKTLHEQIEDLRPIEVEQLFTIKDGENNVILSGANVCSYLDEMYGLWKTRSYLHTLWGLYNSMHSADFIRAYNAWVAEYNPLENYNGNEVNVFLTNDGQETTEITHGKTTTITANDVQNDTYVTTDDSTTPRLENRNKQTGNTTDAESGTTTTTVDRETKNLTIDGTTYTADNVHGEIKNRHGNLGVTTSQQMITSEIDMRMNPLIQLYIDTFVNDYAYYVG